MIIAEVEGESSGQPEQKLYKAIGQMVMCVSQTQKNGWEARFIIAVFGEAITEHLAKATCLKNIGVSGLSIKSADADEEWQSVI